jgi:enamine deaminase RidA (YjgF/YER057c/UK114 family)
MKLGVKQEALHNEIIIPDRQMSRGQQGKNAHLTKEDKAMERQITNPWTWQDQDGFVQACQVQGGQKVLYCSGQLSVDPNGKPMHPGDMRAQINAALDNLETLLKAAGFPLTDIVRLNIYTTDVDACLKNFDVFINRLTKAGCRHTCSLFGVARLAWVETMVEIEATAVSG